MSRKKETPKPMSGLRHDFIASLGNLCQQSLMTLQALDMVIRHSEIPDPLKEVLTQRQNGLRAALFEEDQP